VSFLANTQIVLTKQGMSVFANTQIDLTKQGVSVLANTQIDLTTTKGVSTCKYSIGTYKK